MDIPEESYGELCLAAIGAEALLFRFASVLSRGGFISESGRRYVSVIAKKANPITIAVPVYALYNPVSG